MAVVASSPMCVQVLPASMDRYIPFPHEELWRLFCSPVPNQRMLGLPGKMAMSPPVLTGRSSVIEVHVMPRLVDFQTPLLAPTTYTVAASLGSASTSCNRPPVTAGPTERNGSRSNG